MSPLRFLLVSTIAVIMVQKGETIKCWFCHSNSPDQAGCSDPFLGSADVDSMFIRECGKDQQIHIQLLPNGTTHATKLHPELNFFCLKLTGPILGVNMVMRGCASGFPNITEGSCMGSEPQKATGGNILTCNTCDGDLCNSF